MPENDALRDDIRRDLPTMVARYKAATPGQRRQLIDNAHPGYVKLLTTLGKAADTPDPERAADIMEASFRETQTAYRRHRADHKGPAPSWDTFTDKAV